MKYSVKLNIVTGKVIITDNETKKTFNGRIGSYTRYDKQGGKITKYQVYFKASEVHCDNNGIVQIPKDSTGHYLTSFETNLESKAATKTVINPAMFEA